MPVVSRPSEQLDRELWRYVNRDLYDLVVIDTPPWQAENGIVDAALRLATTCLVTMMPTTMELGRIGPTWDLLARTGGVGRGAVLLNRVISNTVAARDIRSALEESGRPVLDAQVPLQQTYAKAYGAPLPPRQGEDKVFGQLVDELIKGGCL